MRMARAHGPHASHRTPCPVACMAQHCGRKHGACVHHGSKGWAGEAAACWAAMRDRHVMHTLIQRVPHVPVPTAPPLKRWPCPRPRACANAQVLSWDPRIFVYRGFLSDEECEAIKKAAGPRLYRSGVVDAETGQVGVMSCG